MEKKPRYSKSERTAIEEVHGPASDVLASAILKRTGRKINAMDDRGNQLLDTIAMAAEKDSKPTRIKQARKLGYTAVGISGAGVIGS